MGRSPWLKSKSPILMLVEFDMITLMVSPTLAVNCCTLQCFKSFKNDFEINGMMTHSV